MDLQKLMKLEMFPFIDACHYTLMSMAVREDAPQLNMFSKNHPFACWIATIFMSFAGNIISSALLGDSLLDPLQDLRSILLATFCWYIINFSPYDIVYKTCCIMPIRISICIIKEFQRTSKIHYGILLANKKYENAFLVWIIVGTMRGAGSSFMRTVIEILIHSQTSALSGFKIPATSKACLSVSILFTFQIFFGNSLSLEKVYAVALIFLIYIRLTILLLSIHDPFIPVENFCCGLLFGNPLEKLKNVYKTLLAASDEKNSTENPKPYHVNLKIQKEE